MHLATSPIKNNQQSAEGSFQRIEQEEYADIASLCMPHPTNEPLRPTGAGSFWAMHSDLSRAPSQLRTFKPSTFCNHKGNTSRRQLSLQRSDLAKPVIRDQQKNSQIQDLVGFLTSQSPPPLLFFPEDLGGYNVA